MDISDKDWLEHFQKVDYIHRVIVNGGNGLVTQVKENRAHCDAQHATLKARVDRVVTDMRMHKIRWTAYSTMISGIGWVLWQALNYLPEFIKVWKQVHH